MPQDLFRIVDEDEAQLSAEFLRHVLEVPLIPARQDHGSDTSSVSRQDLLLDPADREDLAAERDLARHGYFAPHRPPGGERGQRRHDGDPGRGPILGDGPGRHVHVDGLALEELGIDVERLGVGPDVGNGGLSALAHNVSEHTGEDEPLVGGGHHGDLHEQDVPTSRRPGQAGRDTRTGGPLGHLVEEPWPTEVLRQAVGADPDRLVLALGQPTGYLSGHGRDLALEAPDASLAGVPPHDSADGLGFEGELVGGEAMGGELLRDQILSGDPDLLLIGVPGQDQDLHPVTQGPGDRVEGVGRRDEEHVRQVEGHPEVVVYEGVVLGWIQHLQ